ncbi:MAG TPA: hypothetical protein VGH30_03270 [Jatrophihabitantaceae bacterium]
MVEAESGAPFVYHVGAHKTGTSLLQHYLSSNRPMLRERRILYIGRAVADQIARAREDPEVADEAKAHLRKFRRRSEAYDVFLASYENALGPPFSRARKDRGLYPRSAARMAALVKTLRMFRPKILLTVRPPAEFLESYYLQSVHQGGYLEFGDWLDQHVDLELLSWRPIIDNLISAFGADAVEVVDFRMIRTSGADGYLRELLNRMMPGTALETGAPAVSNASISDKGLRLALAGNPYLRDKDEQIAMRRFLQTRFSNLAYPRPVLLSDDQKRWLHDRYSQDYDDLFAGGADRVSAE